MLMKRSFLVATAMVLGLTVVVSAAEISQDDVLLKTELEAWGRTTGLTPTGHPEASGGIAMSMASDAVAVSVLQLPPGEYTLVIWQYAPGGDADGFFVEIAGERTRLLGTIGSWSTLTLPFTVRDGTNTPIAIIGQEPTMTIDRIAVVRGTYEHGEIEFADIPGDTTGDQLSLDQIERLATPCKLAEPLEAPLAADSTTVYTEDFNAQCAVFGDHHWIDGPFGQALVLEMPDGRFDVDANALQIGEQGTVEWWVKTREAARVWWDQGWHYFLRATPAEPGGTQFDLDKHITTLTFTATPNGAPYEFTDGVHEAAFFNVGNVDNEDWHHVLVSWDLSGERQHLWVMVDGHGTEKFFPRTFEPPHFARIEFGNTPSEWDIPHLSMDGTIDSIRISNVSVADRLAQ